jgi:hypothetical protein
MKLKLAWGHVVHTLTTDLSIDLHINQPAADSQQRSKKI